MKGKAVGWIGVAFGLLVAPFQLVKILSTGCVSGISLGTYACLVAAVGCYFWEAVRVRNKVFMTSNGIGLVVNSAILILILVLQ